MIIARGEKVDGKGEALILGLSRGNVERLTGGKPIHLTPETHPGIPAGWTLLILFGETEQAIVDELRQAGALAKTTITRDPRLDD